MLQDDMNTEEKDEERTCSFFSRLAALSNSKSIWDVPGALKVFATSSPFG
jgi:hypothetical protein